MGKLLKPEKVVLFDIDYTLFDTEMYREKLYKAMSMHTDENIDTLKEAGQKIYNEISLKFGYFNPDEFINRLAKRLSKESKVRLIEKEIWNEENFISCLYAETKEVLTQLKGKVIIGIFSKGHDLFQRKKLSAIKDFFDEKNIHIQIDKFPALASVLGKYKSYRLYLVDDAMPVLSKAKYLRPDIITIWVKRGRFAASQVPIAGFEPNATVDDLKNIKDIISSN